ncbi:MAG: tRNA preQ1(34) S-adenosylmethionine ribosyltransferase-isomerase QueA [Candidatus Krumholzibacteriota bacterium]|nr:tRNA preQ1(34) S-adenosylmethionine ribosyltransferase-isomerase QueA [Candidatus Krumholzibacteriota bacterium]
MNLNDFNYELPEDLIAQYPAEKRDDSRMILFNRSLGEIRETRFSNFARYLQDGELIVVNETKVIPARLYGSKETGATIELFLTRDLGGNRWRALCRPSKRLRPGDSLYIGEAGHEVKVDEEIGEGEWIVSLPDTTSNMQFIKRFGNVPLPPYIKREMEDDDVERYQTIFAREDGSVAAPTAGLHFTEKVFRDIAQRGGTVIPITLHVGPGTFRPLESEIVEENILSPEYIMIRKDYWDAVREAKDSGRSIVAVGTTVTRTLEALASGKIIEEKIKVIDEVEYITGWTDLFIYPGFEFKVVDALVTNLHLPMSSLFVLVSAFAGREKMLNTYKWAVQRRFRFYSYGDVMFIR